MYERHCNMVAWAMPESGGTEPSAALTNQTQTKPAPTPPMPQRTRLAGTQVQQIHSWHTLAQGSCSWRRGRAVAQQARGKGRGGTREQHTLMVMLTMLQRGCHVCLAGFTLEVQSSTSIKCETCKAHVTPCCPNGGWCALVASYGMPTCPP